MRVAYEKSSAIQKYNFCNNEDFVYFDVKDIFRNIIQCNYM